MQQTEIKLIRKDSKGIAGTYENIDHHAKEVEPFVKLLESLAPKWGFKVWRQGHNVHEFTSHSGQNFTLRPVFEDVDGGRRYFGIRLSLRVSRSQEFRLADIADLADILKLDTTMRLLAKPPQGTVGGQVQKHVV